MPSKCCVPLCKGNYNGQPSVSTFAFPKEEALRKKWFEAIQKSPSTYSNHSRVCEVHFRKEDILRRTQFTIVSTGEVVEAPLLIPRLASDAVPCFFPERLEDPIENYKQKERSEKQKKKQKDDIHLSPQEDIIEEEKLIILSDVCTVCLLKTDHMKDLLEPREEILQIVKRLSSFSNVEIEVNDTVPHFICKNCEENLIIAYDFQQLWKRSQNNILTCLSARSANTKVYTVKPFLSFENNCEKSTTPSVDNSSEGYISFVDVDGLEKKVPISYYALPDKPDLVGTSKSESLTENRQKRNEALSDEVPEIKVKPEDCDDVQMDSGTTQVSKENQWGQGSELPRHSQEEVEGIIQTFRKRFSKHVECRYCDFTTKDSRLLTFHITGTHKDLCDNWCLLCNNHFDNLQEHIEAEHRDEYTCPLCEQYNVNTNQLMRHLASHAPERKYVCNRCGKCFISRQYLNFHMVVHEKRFQCYICRELFLRRSLLVAHLKGHKIRRCKKCLDHFPSAEGEKPHVCSNGEVQEEVQEEAAGDANIVELRPNKKEVLKNFCKICNLRVRSITHHVQQKHSNTVEQPELKFLCSYCGKRLRSLSKLTIHVRVHTKEKPYQCSYCDKRSATKINMVLHERTHTGERPYICQICGKAFKQRTPLNMHMRVHVNTPPKSAPKKPQVGGKTYDCLSCPKKFLLQFRLREHMRQHTGEKPFICDVCGKSFAVQSYLREHKRVHSEERPFKCKYCDRSFKQHSTYRQHTNIHLGKTPFKCPHCNYGSRHSHPLKKHMRHHNRGHNLDGKCKICNQNSAKSETELKQNMEHGNLEKDKEGEDVLVGVSTEETVNIVQ